MIINRIELVNYCQHEHRVIDVSGNLIAVVGHNGVGKSNMLGALQFALTGEQPGKTKDSLLHWGAKEGHVTLDFVQDGKPGHLERSVSGPKVTLEYDGVTTSGITNVAKELETRLHIDKDLVKQSVFVRQTEIDTIISAKTDKRDREVAFQKLLGLDAAKIHKNLTDWMYAATKPVNYDIQLTEAEQRLGALESRKEEMEESVKKADLALFEVGSVEESTPAYLTKGVAAIAAVLDAKGRLASCAYAAKTAEEAVAAEQAKTAAAGENPNVDVFVKSAEIATLTGEIKAAEAVRAAEADLADAQQKLQAATEAAHPTEEDVTQAEERLRTATDERSRIQHEIDTRKKSLGALSGGESVCPVCGKPLDADMVDRLRKELTDYEARLQVLNTQVYQCTNEVNSLRAHKSTYDTALLTATSRKDAAIVALSRLTPPTVAEDVARATIAENHDAISKQQAYDRAVAGHKAAIQDAEIKKTVADNALADAQKRLSAAEATAIELCGPEAAADWEQAKLTMETLIAEADKRRQRVVDLKVALAQAKAARDEVVNSLATLKGTVESLKAEQAKQDVLAKKLAVLERVRDWFHYANGPRVLVKQVLAALTDDVNRFLGNFTAPFIVLPDDEQLGFKVEFTDGRTRPEEPPGTDVLSGGERVQLAVAFRLAIYAMFAGKLGLLSLDEPTAYLDDGNVDRFGVLLTKVKELARNMNTQVFMATHERAVIPHMDSVIDLN